MFLREIQERLIECRMEELPGLSVERGPLIMFGAVYMERAEVSEREYSICVCSRKKKKKISLMYYGDAWKEDRRGAPVEVVGKILLIAGRKRFLCFYLKRAGAK